MNSSNSSWEYDLSEQVLIDDEEDFKAVIDTLEEARIDHFKLIASFYEKYQQDDFEREWQLQNESQETQKKERKSRRVFIHRPSGFPREETMDLGSDYYRGTVFSEVYKQELQQLQCEYKVKMYINRSKLYIFSKENEDLNMICRNRLLDMKHKLQLFYAREPQLIMMIAVSQTMRQKLQKKGVRVIFRQNKGQKQAIFFSIDLDLTKIIKVIQEITQYDISIINLEHSSILNAEIICVKEIIEKSLKKEIQNLRKEYEIDIEFPPKDGFIVFHSQYDTFGQQSINSFSDCMDSLVILSVKSSNIKLFDNLLKKMLKRSTPFAYEIMNSNRNETFVCIDLRQLKPLYTLNMGKDKLLAKEIEEFLKLFAVSIETNFELKIYFSHYSIDAIEKCLKRVINFAEEYNLVFEDNDFYDLNLRKATLRLKDYSQAVLPKKQKQLLLFLQELLSVSRTEQSAVNILDESSFSQLNSHNTSNYSMTNSLGSTMLLQQDYEIPWLKLIYSPPQTRDFGDEDRDFIQGRRNRELQDLFYSKCQFKFKISKVELSCKIKIPEKGTNPRPYFLKQAVIPGCYKLRNDYKMATISSFKVKQQGIIAYITQELNMPFIPVFIFRRFQ